LGELLTMVRRTALALCALLTGCATFNTISNAGINTPKVYSGTRLNAAALRDDDDRLRRFPAAPPRHPAADLPLSLVLDTALLPMTVPVALYEVLFEPR
jgi:uncharacterized protein YceK